MPATPTASPKPNTYVISCLCHGVKDNVPHYKTHEEAYDSWQEIHYSDEPRQQLPGCKRARCTEIPLHILPVRHQN